MSMSRMDHRSAGSRQTRPLSAALALPTHGLPAARLTRTRVLVMTHRHVCHPVGSDVIRRGVTIDVDGRISAWRSAEMHSVGLMMTASRRFWAHERSSRVLRMRVQIDGGVRRVRARDMDPPADMLDVSRLSGDRRDPRDGHPSECRGIDISPVLPVGTAALTP
jgi:hypothetical protein